MKVEWKKNSQDLVWSKNKKLKGVVEFFQLDKNNFLIKIQLSGLTPNSTHGFHIHTNKFNTKQECSEDKNCCDLLGGHFNPYNKNHGSIYNSNPNERHAGDLCNNICSDDQGNVVYEFTDNLISCNKKSKAYIGNRSIVIHKYPDDLGRQGFQGQTYEQMTPAVLKWLGRKHTAKILMEKSLIDGNAGTRIACGNII